QKTIVISCCSSGIGHALAREYKTQGLRVFATARKTSSIQDLADLGIETLPLEATSQESIRALYTEIATRTNGSLDYLVNNAGRNYTVPALDISLDEIRLTYETNVFAPMLLCQAFAPLLSAAKGTIIQIGSLAGKMPYVFGSVYNSTKAALHSYSDTLRIELAPFDVKVVTIVTGGVQSSIARTHRDLPEGLLYVPVAKQYERRLTHSQANGMPSVAYARSVARQTLGRGKDTVWERGGAGRVWFLSTFSPRKVMVSFFFLFIIFSLASRASDCRRVKRIS
ncbi:NAD(P)-binding protein, partial [Teratosphaeria nubilosa]